MECWRCATEIVAGSRFCPGCGAQQGTPTSAKSPASSSVAPPIERDHAADPLAATTPADASHLAALRRGELPARGSAPVIRPAAGTPASSAQSAGRGGTTPLKSVPSSQLASGQAPGHMTPGQAPAPHVTPAPVRRAVPKTQEDLPTLPSAGPGSLQHSPVAPHLPRAPVPQPTPAAVQPQRPMPQPGPSPQVWQQHAQQQQHPQGGHAVPPYPTPGVATGGLHVGAKVSVEWADGRRYPGTVQQLAPGQCLVLFNDGQQRWIDVRRIARA